MNPTSSSSEPTLDETEWPGSIFLTLEEAASEIAEMAHPERFTENDGQVVLLRLLELGVARTHPGGWIEVKQMDFEDLADVVCESLGIVGYDY